MKILIFILIGFLLLGIIILGSYVNSKYVYTEKSTETRYYQGPVPEGYDEEHFRLTGETRLLESIDG